MIDASEKLGKTMIAFVDSIKNVLNSEAGVGKP